MIVDTSALIAILRAEPDALAFAQAIAGVTIRRISAVNFLEAAIVFLLATNAASALAALYAMRLANAVSVVPQAKSAVARRLDAIVSRRS